MLACFGTTWKWQEATWQYVHKSTSTISEAFGAGAGVGNVSSNASDANILFEATSRTSGFQTANPSKEGTTSLGWSVGLAKPNKEAF